MVKYPVCVLPDYGRREGKEGEKKKRGGVGQRGELQIKGDLVCFNQAHAALPASLHPNRAPSGTVVHFSSLARWSFRRKPTVAPATGVGVLSAAHFSRRIPPNRGAVTAVGQRRGRPETSLFPRNAPAVPFIAAHLTLPAEKGVDGLNVALLSASCAMRYSARAIAL